MSALRRIAGREPDTADGVRRALVADRNKVAERFALLQCELGGLFYEMANRDHLRLEVLIERAAELQRLDAELGRIDHLLSGEPEPVGRCPACSARHPRGAAYCSACGTALAVR